MKRAAAVLTAFFAVLCLSFSAFAESENRLSAYQSLAWEGAPLEYDPDHETLSFLGNSEAESASVTVPTEGARGFWFYADLGNFENGGVGYLTVELLNADGEAIEQYKTEKTAGDGSFHRYSLGSEETYARIPENAEALRLSFHHESGKTPYLRNLGLYLDSMKTVDSSAPEWSVSGKLRLVQVGVTKAQYWSWVFLIAAVPILMFATRKMMDRAKKIK